MLDFFKNIMNSGPKADLGEMLAEGAVVIDVRTRQEYQAGHVKGSKNIPLNEISSKVEMIRKMNRSVITCCASGARSGSAASQLKSAGIEAVNGGPWTRVNQHM